MRDGDDGEGLHGFDVGDEQALGRVHCDADVVGGAGVEVRVRGGGGGGDAGVEDGIGVEGEGEGFEDEGEVGEFWRGGLVLRGGEGGGVVEVGAEAGEGGDVEFVGVEEVRDGEGAGHCSEHLGLDWGEGDWGLGLGCRRTR